MCPVSGRQGNWLKFCVSVQAKIGIDKIPASIDFLFPNATLALDFNMVVVAQWQSSRLWSWLLRVRVPSITPLPSPPKLFA